MKAYIVARGLNEAECPICGTRLPNRVSRCPKYQAAKAEDKCEWQPGYWFAARFWPVTPTEFDGTAEEIAKFKKCPDLVTISEDLLDEKRGKR